MSKRVVTFTCGHTVMFGAPYPKVGDTGWCTRCRRDTVVLLAPGEWRIRCIECQLSRAYGEDRQMAEIAIGRHRRRWQGHMVKLYNGNKLIMTFGQISGYRDETQKIF